MRLIESAVVVFVFGILCFSFYEAVCTVYDYSKKTEEYESMSKVLELIYKKIENNEIAELDSFLQWRKIIEKDVRMENTSFEMIPLKEKNKNAAAYSFSLKNKPFRVLMLIEGEGYE